MAQMLLRSKTIDLLQTRELTKGQKINSELNLREAKTGRRVLRSFPRRIVFELTNTCNLRCIMCGRSEASFKETFLSLKDLKRFSEAFHRSEEVTLLGWGEPTVHPQFREILAYLQDFPIRKYFVTNGARLQELKDDLFNYGVDIMAVSVNGARAATNDRIRVGSDLVLVISSLKEIVKEKRKRKTTLPYINFVFTAMRSNLKELPELVRLAQLIGLDEVKAVYFTVFSEKLSLESLWDHRLEVEKVFATAIQVAESLNINIKLPYIQGEDPAREEYHKTCFAGWRDLFIGSDGYLRPCQSTSLKFFPFDRRPTFEKIWNSPEYQNFRARVNNPDRMPDECKRCYQSTYANWNRREAFMQIGQRFAPEWELPKESQSSDE